MYNLSVSVLLMGTTSFFAFLSRRPHFLHRKLCPLPMDSMLFPHDWQTGFLNIVLLANLMIRIFSRLMVVGFPLEGLLTPP